MVETTTTSTDAGKRCDHCGKRLDHQPTWWIAGQGEYCSSECGARGADELERTIQLLEKQFENERRG